MRDSETLAGDRAAATNCGSCRRFTLDPTDEMGALGYGRCALQPAGHFRVPASACAFDPSRFEARA